MRRAAFISLLVLTTPTAALADDKAPTAELKFAAPAEGDPFAIATTDRLTLMVPHPYSREEASHRLSYLLEYWKKRFDISSQWRGERVFVSGKLYGLKIRALFSVDQGSIVGVASDPGWPLRGRVVEYVDQKLKKYLHPTYDDP